MVGTFTVEFVNLLTEVGPYLIMFVLGVLVGSLAPTYYATERMRGFGRAMFRKLPYKPPPGMEREEALRAATENEYEDEEVAGDDSTDSSDEGEA